ncbi:lipid A biosynthesis acyltransferase [Flavobacterium sp. Sd200]|uniref:lysophospholipid acyltransferase family protein n=1 Tax=Flavobacterium sp. Sd200 TaxID=2692211 RepID=UPI00136E6697|nr:lysophospholipid acyltransferase family protein [Flavobacterium sp. Sd200]MXN90692.1 lipid A biosynthesis acyltransferase [Flavobacterium sp. Sd200]
MHLLGYIVLYPIFWFISILPFRVLYFLSDILYVVAYKIVGYRKKTVRLNLALALPHLSAKERLDIERKFFHHFCDTLVEMIKTINISEKEMKKRFILENIELVHEYEAKGKSIALICAHYGSYEWLLIMNKYLSTHKGYGIYKTIRNKYFDALVKKIRNKFDAYLIDTRAVIPAIRDHKRKGILAYYGFLSDQSPKLDSAIYWTNLFGMEVPVHVGAEMLAKKMDLNVMMVKGAKIKRGYYKATFISLEKEPKEYANYEITDIFLRLMEEQIREQPEYYLWTHKRFKHRRNDPPGFIPPTNS